MMKLNDIIYLFLIFVFTASLFLVCKWTNGIVVFDKPK